MANETLQLLAREVRGKTFRILDGVSESEARFVPPGLNNSIHWHAGHCYWVVEVLSIAAATGQAPQFPSGWVELFSSKSRPTRDTKFPPLAQVIEALRNQLERLLSAIQPLTPQQLAVMIDPARNRTVRYNILHGLHDEANHQGEMWLLRKLQNANAR
ncbi:MAG TPA: DinB family protein [Tepidisphaeraceae bacterium]|jgi:hypothetical protein|nr:DinB family protein [Tepidisphaeraceae bacterium]